MRLLFYFLDRNRSADTGVGLVVAEFEVFEGEIEDRGDGRIQVHRREREGFAGQLGFDLPGMIGVQMRIAEGVHEVAGLKIADLRQHHR